jgi:hypothetical protein
MSETDPFKEHIEKLEILDDLSNQSTSIKLPGPLMRFRDALDRIREFSFNPKNQVIAGGLIASVSFSGIFHLGSIVNIAAERAYPPQNVEHLAAITTPWLPSYLDKTGVALEDGESSILLPQTSYERQKLYNAVKTTEEAFTRVKHLEDFKTRTFNDWAPTGQPFSRLNFGNACVVAMMGGLALLLLGSYPKDDETLS